MIHAFCPVLDVHSVAQNIFVLAFSSDTISATVLPGQFVSIRTDESTTPLLRRPFSVYRTKGERVEIIFNVIGKGTASLSRKHAGDLIDIIGPLGVPFNLFSEDYDTALLMGGGLGVAPLPITTERLLHAGKSVVTFLGSRTSAHLVETHLTNLHVATDDGSKGFRGNVVELMQNVLDDKRFQKPKFFVCGPTAMLRAAANVAIARSIACEVSLEGPMGCGFGICQGCPVELLHGERKFVLMCKDGPTFDVRRIVI